MRAAAGKECSEVLVGHRQAGKRAELGADKHLTQPFEEAAQAKVVGEMQPERQRDARRDGIDLPWVHSENSRSAQCILALDRAQHASR